MDVNYVKIFKINLEMKIFEALTISTHRDELIHQLSF